MTVELLYIMKQRYRHEVNADSALRSGFQTFWTKDPYFFLHSPKIYRVV